MYSLKTSGETILFKSKSCTIFIPIHEIRLSHDLSMTKTFGIGPNGTRTLPTGLVHGMPERPKWPK